MTEAAGSLIEGAHVLPVRVYYEDTDAGGVVYYANYLKYAERGRSEMIRHAGLENSRIWEEDGVAFAVRRREADFIRPARLDDLLEVWTTLGEVKGASLDMDQTIRRDGEEIARIGVRLACMNASGQPARLPAQVRGVLETFVNTSQRD